MSVFLKVDEIDYRAVIKFFVKEVLTPNEIHSKFIKELWMAYATHNTLKPVPTLPL